MTRSALLAGRVLVTGATGGIGGAIARACAARGAELVLSGRRADALEPLAAELGAEMVLADLSRPHEVESLAAAAGAVDVLINNAALPGSGAVDDFSAEEIARAVQVNLTAPMLLARALGAGMLSRGRGHVVFISSISGKSATAGSAVYSATKFGMRGFAIGLREDWRRRGVGVSTVFPGFISEAGMFADTGVDLPRGVALRSPEDVARAVVKAVERDCGELDVAPLSLSLGARLALLAPGPANALSRRLGSERIAADMAAAQRDKR